jgi:hypothetical protein
MFFGTISPMTMCRKATIVSATMKPIVCNRPSGTSPNTSTASSIRPATVGSAT